MSAKSSCLIDPNNFCYICGKYCFKKQLVEMDQGVHTHYEQYFGRKVHQTDVEWSPSLCCNNCKLRLWKCITGNDEMPFATPMQWRKPRIHRKDCYFCTTILPKPITAQSIHKIVYPSGASVDLPQPLLAAKAIPNPAGGSSTQPQEMSSSANTTTTSASDGNPRYKKPYNQKELNDLIRDLNLNKSQSELLASRLKQRGFADDNTKITFYRQRNHALLPYFKKDGELTYCDDVAGLFNAMKQKYQCDEWRLFIDSSKESLVAALIHIGNEKPSVPIGEYL